MFLFDEHEIFYDTGFFATMVEGLDVLKNVFRFSIKFFLQWSDKGLPLSSAIGCTKSVAESTGVERKHCFRR
jgi:hypothetical protein